jgi:hypothetical protein
MRRGVDEVVVLAPTLPHNVGEPGVPGQVLAHRLPQPLERSVHILFQFNLLIVTSGITVN